MYFIISYKTAYFHPSRRKNPSPSPFPASLAQGWHPPPEWNMGQPGQRFEGHIHVLNATN